MHTSTTVKTNTRLTKCQIIDMSHGELLQSGFKVVTFQSFHFTTVSQAPLLIQIYNTTCEHAKMTISKQLFTFNFSKNHIGRTEIVHFCVSWDIFGGRHGQVLLGF